MNKKKDGFKNEKYIIPPIESFSSYLKHPMVKSLFLTDIGYFPNALYHYRERANGAHETILIYCLYGIGTIELKNKKIQLSKGTLFCIPENTAHKYYADKSDPWTILWIHFKGTYVDYFPINDLNIVVLEDLNLNETIQQHFIKLFQAIESGYTLGNIIYISQLLSMMLSKIYLFENESQMNNSNQYLTRIIKYMSELFKKICH